MNSPDEPVAMTPYDEASPPGPSQGTLADVYNPLRMGKAGWIILGMVLVTALAFFIVVVCLGVDNS